ncbi:FxSxx-COOH system tetratricopeptide repeat protein [Herbidospora mongoliensis]|uniref:FxSxx-COOH system tetratricopeptide repeat protein n=1 Tax=Herbidospora mongoliensis TaxID=688067 RepID=UPI0008313B35|nr:FxSxx-COOH system tetratricopeptide repeat protein [Herbidospora mongoliensis]
MELSKAAHNTPDRQPTVWERVPPKNLHFTGRQSLLDSLRDNLTHVSAVVLEPQAQALRGQGGVGKTQLAIEYAWRFRRHYDLVCWIPAEKRELVPASLAALAPHLGLPPSTGVGIEETARSVKRTLEKGEPFRRWLVIFDNADEPAALADYIPAGPGHALITTRNAAWARRVQSLAVDVFSRDESIAFLLGRVRREMPAEKVSVLAEKLGDLPLALEQAGALMYETAMDLDEYSQLLDAQTTDLMHLGKADDYPQSMAAAWQLSVHQLRRRLPEAIEVLRCCAFFGPEPIPRDVFRRGTEADTPRIAAILADPLMLTKSLRVLGRYALAKIDSTTRTIQVHRLIQALLREDLTMEEQHDIRHEVHLLLAQSAPKDAEDNTNWKAFEELVPHITYSNLAECATPNVRTFALNTIRYLYRVGNYELAHARVTELIEKWTERDGPNHIDVLVARKHLGNVLRGMGEFSQAYRTDHDTLEAMRESLGADHSETLWATNSYGSTLRARGEFQRAREQDSELLVRYREAHPEDTASAFRVRHNLAIDHSLTSDYTSAQTMFQGLLLDLNIARENVAPAQLLGAWSGLSRVVRLCGDYESAVDVGQDAYEYGTDRLSLDHHETLRAAKDLSIAQRRRGDVNDALDLAELAYARLRHLLGEHHPDTMAAAVNLSNANRVKGNLDEAYRLALEVTPMYPQVYDQDHPYYHATRGNLAVLMRLRGEPEHAWAINGECLEALGRRLGYNHDYTLTCAVNLQSDLAALGRANEAVEGGRELHERISKVFGEDHFMALSCASNLSLDLRAVGHLSEADALRQKTLDLYRHDDSMNYPDAVSAENKTRINCDFDPQPI